MLGMSVRNESRAPQIRDPVKCYVVRVCALGASPLVLVFALGELLDDLGAERRHVVGVAARDETLISNYLLVHPVAARVADVGLQGGVRGQGTSLHHVGFDERPRTVADHSDRLGMLEEGMDEAHCLVAAAQFVCPYGAAGHDQTVVLIGGDL